MAGVEPGVAGGGGGGGLRPFLLAAAAVVGGVAVHVAGFFAFQVVPPKPQPATPRPSFMRLVEWQDQADLFGTEPLFLPTRWNYASRFSGVREEPAPELFSDYPARLEVGGEVLRPRPAPVPGEALEPETLLGKEHWDFFSGFGQRPVSGEKLLQARAGFLEVVELSTGRRVEARAVGREAFVGAGAAAGGPPVDALWERVTFTVLVEAGRPVGEPLLARGSGVGPIDEGFRRYLGRPGALEGLAPGYYQVCLVP